MLIFFIFISQNNILEKKYELQNHISVFYFPKSFYRKKIMQCKMRLIFFIFYV